MYRDDIINKGRHWQATDFGIRSAWLAEMYLYYAPVIYL